MAGPDTLEFTDANFDQEVLGSDKPVMVDFWAEWCQPCKALGPIIDELATDYKGKAKVGKLDIDSNQQAASKYQVVSIPTVIVFKDGQEKQRFVGLRGKKDFAASLDGAAG